jgi:hypothetical protein
MADTLFAFIPSSRTGHSAKAGKLFFKNYKSKFIKRTIITITYLIC